MWKLLVFLLIISAMNHFVKKFGFNQLSYTQSFDRTHTEMETPVRLETTLENDKWLPILHLNVTQDLGEAVSPRDTRYITYLLPKQRLVRKQEVTFHQRGLYTPEVAELALGDFIGLNEVRAFTKPELSLIVFPKKEVLEDTVVISGSVNGDISVKRWILDDPLMPLGIREYTGFEPQKYIHWGSTARLGKLMVKQFDFTQDSSVLVVLNCELAKPSADKVDETPIEEALVLARSVVEFLEENRLSYGFISNEKCDKETLFKVPSGLGEAHLTEILRHLGSLKYKRTFFIEKILEGLITENRGYQSIFVISPTVLESYVEPLNQLSKHVPKLTLLTVDDKNHHALSPSILKMHRRPQC